MGIVPSTDTFVQAQMSLQHVMRGFHPPSFTPTVSLRLYSLRSYSLRSP